ncbi:MAG TPA: hypothetical protein VIR01_17285, partial [Pyrinomonadaceae bacterium]
MSCLLNGGECIRSDGRLVAVNGFTAAHPAEDEEIEKVHGSENYQDHAHLHREGFNSLLRIVDQIPEFQGEANVAKVDQVKADYQEMVYGVGEGFVSVEDVNQENSSVFVEG